MMSLSTMIDGKAYRVNINSGQDLSIPVHFRGAQPNAFGVPMARADTCRSEDFVGDTREGGSCNFEKLEMIPHCNGTHTEGVGHLTHQRISISEIVVGCFSPCTLISLEPELARDLAEDVAVNGQASDKILSKKILEQKLMGVSDIFLEALVVRTLPNHHDKPWASYGEKLAPYFSCDAIKYLVARGVKHLLVDLPSLDRMFDEGKLKNHRLFWNLPSEGHDMQLGTFKNHTVTELIYASSDIPDGPYMLHLQVPHFMADAAPSRPILYPLEEER